MRKIINISLFLLDSCKVGVRVAMPFIQPETELRF